MHAVVIYSGKLLFKFHYCVIINESSSNNILIIFIEMKNRCTVSNAAIGTQLYNGIKRWRLGFKCLSENENIFSEQKL